MRTGLGFASSKDFQVMIMSWYFFSQQIFFPSDISAGIFSVNLYIFPLKFLEKNPEKLETLSLIPTCVSIIKQPRKKMVEIPQDHDFLT